VVSKEEVAPGRKGSGGAWGSTSRNAGLTGPAPQNGRIRTLAQKKHSQTVGRRAVGYKLVVLKMACSQSGYTFLRHSLVPPVYEQFKVLGVLVERCDACHFLFLNGAARNSALALH
jgi:hypothetical protein